MLEQLNCICKRIYTLVLQPEFTGARKRKVGLQRLLIQNLIQQLDAQVPLDIRVSRKLINALLYKLTQLLVVFSVIVAQLIIVILLIGRELIPVVLPQVAVVLHLL